jgi:hypothetical protein
MRVLDRPAVSSKPSKDGRVITQETPSKQAGMVEQTFDNADKRTEREVVAWRKGWWRHSIFGVRAMITRTERDGGEPCRIMD